MSDSEELTPANSASVGPSFCSDNCAGKQLILSETAQSSVRCCCVGVRVTEHRGVGVLCLPGHPSGFARQKDSPCCCFSCYPGHGSLSRCSLHSETGAASSRSPWCRIPWAHCNRGPAGPSGLQVLLWQHQTHLCSCQETRHLLQQHLGKTSPAGWITPAINTQITGSFKASRCI